MHPDVDTIPHYPQIICRSCRRLDRAAVVTERNIHSDYDVHQQDLAAVVTETHTYTVLVHSGYVHQQDLAGDEVVLDKTQRGRSRREVAD